MIGKISRRHVLKAMPAAAAVTALPVPLVASSTRAASAEPVLIGVPTAQTAQAGVADHQDYLNGTTLAIEEINAAGGVLGVAVTLLLHWMDQRIRSLAELRQVLNYPLLGQIFQLPEEQSAGVEEFGLISQAMPLAAPSVRAPSRTK